MYEYGPRSATAAYLPLPTTTVLPPRLRGVSAHPAQPTCHCQAAPALPATASLLMRACEYVYCVVMLWWREVQMAATARQILGSEELGCRQWGGQSTTALAFSQARGLCIPLHHP